MAVETYIDRARTRVGAEREAVDAKLDAYETFTRRVRELETETSPSSTERTTTAGATHLATDGSGSDRCWAVRTAFAETVRPHSIADVDESESLLETIREEFTDAIAVALAPTTVASFTPELKQMVLSQAQSRRSEVAALQRALGREAARLDTAAETVDDIVDWLVDANETPLTHLGFDTLKQRHGILSSHRARCEDVARDRQAFLQETTNEGLGADVHHHTLIPYLYQEFAIDHPVLTTVATVDETCRECQRVVRDHLVRRA
jgi:hypothetical protein